MTWPRQRFLKPARRGIPGLALLVSTLLAPWSLGQIREIADPDVLVPDAVSISGFSLANLPNGAEATNLLAAYGITFKGTDKTTPKLVFESSRCELQARAGIIQNQSNEGPSTGTPLTILFDFPLRRVGVELGGTAESFFSAISATVQAYDSQGRLMGGVRKTLERVSDHCVQFVGLESTGPGIAKLTINYGQIDEEIGGLLLEHVTPLKFVTYLPHIASGPGLETILDIANPLPIGARGVLQFFDSKAQLLPLTVRRLPLRVGPPNNEGKIFQGSEIELTGEEISGLMSTSFAIQPEEVLTTGYARIEAAVPLQANVTFRALEADGTLISEATITSSPGRRMMVGRLRQSADGRINTGLAFVNTSSNSVVCRISAGGGDLELGAREHKAFFLDEWNPHLRGLDYDFPIVIACPEPVAVGMIQTLEGRPSAALSLASAER